MKIIHPEYEKYKRVDNYWYIIYRVDVLSIKKYYIGSRKTKNLFDNYYGSPGRTNEYFKILKECNIARSYDNLQLSIIEWSTKQRRYKDEKHILQACKHDNNCMNIMYDPEKSNFSYEPGDVLNPFLNKKDDISTKNTLRNKERAGIYHFSHPQYGEYICTISELIDIFRKKDIIIDRGVMNVITQIGSLRNGWPEKYNKKFKSISPTNKYINWTCLDIIKLPYLRKQQVQQLWMSC